MAHEGRFQYKVVQTADKAAALTLQGWSRSCPSACERFREVLDGTRPIGAAFYVTTSPCVAKKYWVDEVLWEHSCIVLSRHEQGKGGQAEFMFAKPIADVVLTMVADQREDSLLTVKCTTIGGTTVFHSEMSETQTVQEVYEELKDVLQMWYRYTHWYLEFMRLLWGHTELKPHFGQLRKLFHSGGQSASPPQRQSNRPAPKAAAAKGKGESCKVLKRPAMLKRPAVKRQAVSSPANDQ